MCALFDTRISVGTTFSGVAYAFKSNGEVLEMTTW